MSEYETVIVGAGAAGLMAAVQCGLRGLPVVVIDSQKKIGRKILISGGGRCNVTNAKMSPTHFNCLSKNFVKSVLKRFTEKDVVAFFEDNGLPLKLEEEFQKYFPVSDKASDVLKVFLDLLTELSIPLLSGLEILAIEKEGDRFCLTTSKNTKISCRQLIISTGGKALPQSGSTGFGFQVAAKFGHDVVEPSPALTPLLSSHEICAELSGYALEVHLSLYEEGKKKRMFSGPLLFTHRGYSGPVVLNVSRHYILSEAVDKRVEANFLPEITEDAFFDFLKSHSSTLISKILREHFSRQFVSYLCAKIGIEDDLNLSNLKKSQRVQFQKELFHFDLSVSGYRDWPFAEVTSGGVNIKELESKTLESKLCKNLFFCGEVIDVDGHLGGYNFQWAFSSAVTIAKSLKVNGTTSKVNNLI